MALTSGTKLGPYEIQSPLGAGGMGEVYRAKDTRLDRTVAIKVLPSHLSSDPESKQRMEREARAISALQHANICTLHDIGAQDGTDFLVMEYLEGQTLAERLEKGALPLDQVLKIGTEIAQALEKAHQQGIVHRDLKPANIMLTKAGAKLMDFGLAKPNACWPRAVAGPLTPSTADYEPGSADRRCITAYAEGFDRWDLSIHGAGSLAGSGGRRAQRPIQLRLRAVRNGHRAPRLRGQITAQRVHCDSGERAGADRSRNQPLAPPMLDLLIRGAWRKILSDRFQSAHDVAMELRWIASMRAFAVGPRSLPPRDARAASAWLGRSCGRNRAGHRGRPTFCFMHRARSRQHSCGSSIPTRRDLRLTSGSCRSSGALARWLVPSRSPRSGRMAKRISGFAPWTRGRA